MNGTQRIVKSTWLYPFLLVSAMVLSSPDLCLGGCDQADASLGCEVSISGTTMASENVIEGYACMGWSMTGPEYIYEMTFAEKTVLQISMTSSEDLGLYFLAETGSGACGDDCVAHADSIWGSGGTEVLDYGADPGTYYLVVDGYDGVADDFSLYVDCGSGTSMCTEDADCLSSHFCKYEIGECGGPGWCTPFGYMCDKEYDGRGDPPIEGPVCGCDGVNYADECDSDTAGMSIAYEGECEVEECGECDGKVTALTLRYDGAAAAYVEVVQKKDDIVIFEDVVELGAEFTFYGADKKGTMSSEIKLYVDGDFHVKIHTSCSDPIGPGLVAGDFEVVEGYSRNGGKLCPVEPQPDCGECDGKVTELTLRYDGASVAYVEVVQKKDDVVIFSDVVEPGAEFSFHGEEKKGTMGTEIKLYVDDDLHVKIHTSCSDPIGPGLVAGDFEVVEGYSRNGGKLCPL